MRKEYVLVKLFLVLFIGSGWAQEFEWAKSEGLWAYDYGYGAAVDNAGNAYIVGKYEENNAKFSDSTVGCAGNHDIFIVKYAPDGMVKWVSTAGGVLGDYATCISTDNNYLYVAGEVEGHNTTIFFENSPIQLQVYAKNDIFVSKYDMNGQVLWAKKAGWFTNEKALGITHDPQGNIYICGFFTDTCLFENTWIYGNGKADMFIAKYDGNGNFQWVRNAGSSERDEAKSIRCDMNGNLYVTGMFHNSITFGGTTLTAPMNHFDMYLVKYDTNGNVVWAKQAGGDYDDVGWGVTVDNAGKIYVAGEFNAYAMFGSIAMTTTGHGNVFVACYDSNGNVQWVKQGGGPGFDRARAINTDGNNVYITGQFGFNASFEGINVSAADTSDIFIAAVSNSGQWLWVKSVGGAADAFEELGYESGCSIAAHPSGAVYASGALLDDGQFGSHYVETWSRTDAFVTKLMQTPTGVEQYAGKSKHQLLSPNPASNSFVIDLKGIEGNVDAKIYNGIGQVVESRSNLQGGKVNFDMSAQQRGIYIVEIKAGDKFIREKLILQ